MAGAPHQVLSPDRLGMRSSPYTSCEISSVPCPMIKVSEVQEKVSSVPVSGLSYLQEELSHPTWAQVPSAKCSSMYQMNPTLLLRSVCSQYLKKVCTYDNIVYTSPKWWLAFYISLVSSGGYVVWVILNIKEVAWMWRSHNKLITNRWTLYCSCCIIPFMQLLGGRPWWTIWQMITNDR